MSTAGASILGVGYLLPMIYLIWSLKYGAEASANPWNATGLEWQTPRRRRPKTSTDTAHRATSRLYEYPRATLPNADG